MVLGLKKILVILGFALISTGAQSQILISLIFGDKLSSPGVEF